jgi:hypothetical protein
MSAKKYGRVDIAALGQSKLALVDNDRNPMHSSKIGPQLIHARQQIMDTLRSSFTSHRFEAGITQE